MREISQYEYYLLLVKEGHGHAKSYDIAYKPLDENQTAREWAKEWRDKGKSYEEIAFWCQLRYSKGSKSVVYRWLNEDAYQKHLKSKRKPK